MSAILIVEDNAAFRKMLSRILISRFPAMHIMEAKEGQTALQKAATNVPDLIFMDVRLPGENGFDLTRRFKAAHPEAIVIMMTSYDSPEYQKASFESGADFFMSKKTSTTEDILQRVASILPSS